MTDSAVDTAAQTEDVPDPGPAPTQRLMLMVVAAVSVVPFFWAAIRDARNGFYPMMDIAATVVRARATFSSNPPLLGMWSSGSSWAGHEIHFPGPILLYLLAAPVHLLGNTWGTLLAMAAINAFWVLLAGYLIYRRLGTNAALVGFLFLNLFIWSLGSENLVDARPMEMVTIPFLCFLILTWLVTSGDIDALPGFVLVANYLFLNHLVMALQIPVISLCAAVGVVLWFRTDRKRRLLPEATAPPPENRGSLRRRLVQAGLVTFVMWLPSLIQQVTASPGNLNLLLSASGQHRSPVGSFAAGYNVTIRLIAQPKFWFRGRFDDGTFLDSVKEFAVGDVLLGVGLALLMGVLAFLAWRRRDKTGLSALAVAVVAIVISIVTVTQAPAQWGFPLQYLRSLWGLAAFVWLALFFNVFRTVKAETQQRLASIAGIGAVVFAVLGLSFANYAAATDMVRSPTARKVVDAVVPQVEGRGRVRVLSGPGFTPLRYSAAVLLGLDTAGITFCVNAHDVQQYGSRHDCNDEADVSILVGVGKHPVVPGSRLLIDDDGLSTNERQEMASSEKSIRTWLATKDEIELTAGASAFVAAMGSKQQRQINDAIAPADGDLSRAINSHALRLIASNEWKHHVEPDEFPAVLVDRNAPIVAMHRYFELRDKTNDRGVWIYEVPNDWEAPLG